MRHVPVSEQGWHGYIKEKDKDAGFPIESGMTGGEKQILRQALRFAFATQHQVEQNQVDGRYLPTFLVVA